MNQKKHPNQTASHQWMTANKARINQQLAHRLRLNDVPDPLAKAIRYSVLNGGKRLRPLLVYASGQALGAPLKQLDAPAAAIELMHCYSLVHDDLPAMDNDTLRRGQPTCHIAFDETTAILAGDALQALAYAVLSESNGCYSLEAQLQMIQTLAKASGPAGMVGGQMLDCYNNSNNNSPLNASDINNIHLRKTAAMIEASVLLGAYAANCQDPTIFRQLQQYGQSIGLAFQIVDDILDQDDTDQSQTKATYPAVLGLNATRQTIDQLYHQAEKAIADLPINTKQLHEIMVCIIHRVT